MNLRPYQVAALQELGRAPRADVIIIDETHHIPPGWDPKIVTGSAPRRPREHMPDLAEIARERAR
jgi:superfamily II DNA or RNA helicase